MNEHKPSPDPEHRPVGDMPNEAFRARAREAVEWMADYLGGVGSYPVLSQVNPGEIRSRLPTAPPEEGESFDAIFADFQDTIIPGITHWNHPAFFGYFAVTGSGPGILGEMLCAALNVNAMVWRSSPAGTELEEHVLDWIRGLLGLPPEYFGVIQDTASSSSLLALAAARHRAYPEVRARGLSGLPRGRIYASSEAHSSIEKAVIALGFGTEGMARIETDDVFRMRPDALRAAIEADLAGGAQPVAVVATIGTTSTTSVDPVREIADIAEKYGIWLHVDAAYAGAAAMLPEHRVHFDGWERADSIVFNPHKWLFTPVDCSILYTRVPEVVRSTFSLVPEYLRTAEQDRTTDLMDYGVALGRRFRSLKLWFVLRYFGAEGLRARIREHIRMAGVLAAAVDGAPEWERMAPTPFSTVALRFAPEGKSGEDQDELNLAITDAVNRTGHAFLSHTRLRGRISLRLAIGNLRTRSEHVERAWSLLQEEAVRLGSA